MKIPLFDLDGTLIKAGNNVRRVSFSYAIKEVSGLDSSPDEINDRSGMIDSQIFIKLLAVHGISKQKSIEKLPELFLNMEKYLIEHETEMKHESIEGAYELLEELYKKNIPIAVLTGNPEIISWKKLEKTNLKQFISAGAFGNMALIRSELVPIILEKLQLECDKQIQKSDLVIIGDTPNDIICAKQAGIHSIGVATGKYSKEELKKEGADLVVDSLLQKEKLISYLLE